MYYITHTQGNTIQLKVCTRTHTHTRAHAETHTHPKYLKETRKKKHITKQKYENNRKTREYDGYDGGKKEEALRQGGCQAYASIESRA